MESNEETIIFPLRFCSIPVLSKAMETALSVSLVNQTDLK